MASLDERDITQLTLRFLKSHYRQRQREGATVLSSDMRGKGGIVADGFLSFPQVQGEEFQATVEATSYASRHEVRYKVKKSLLSWDSTACALGLAATGFTALYVRKILPMEKYELIAWVAILVAVTFLAFIFFFAMLMRLRRYRYIPAIEQFKKYYANEQWVAIAEDVFPNYHKDRYYLELREQCIYNGFGLLVIRENKPPVMQVTPSRQDLFENRRQLIPLFSQAEFSKAIQKEKYKKIRELLSAALKFKYQKLACLISVLAIAGVLYQESQDRPIQVQDYVDYVVEMEIARLDNRGNIMPDSIRPNMYRIDTPFVWPPPFRKEDTAYLRLELVTQPPPGPSPLLKPEDESKGIITAYPGVAGLITYDCSRLRIEGDAYLIQEGVYTSYDQAAARIAELSSYGLETSGLWLGCFSEAGRSYAVFFGPVFRVSEEARKTMREYETQLGDNVLDIRLEIRALTIK